MAFLQRTPFFRLLLPLIAGILCFQYFEFTLLGWICFVVFGLLCFISSIYVQYSDVQYKFRWLFGCGIFFAVFLTGYWISLNRSSSMMTPPLNEKSCFEVELLSNGVDKGKSIVCKAEVIAVFDSLQQRKKTAGNVMLYLGKTASTDDLRMGDHLLLRAVFCQPSDRVNPYGFDYGLYLRRQNIAATTYVSSDEWVKLGGDCELSVYAVAANLQSKLLSVFRRFGIQGDEFAVLAALTLGNKDELSVDLQQGYVDSGAMHVLSVSGLHVGVVYMVLVFLLRFLERERKTRLLRIFIILVFLWVYAFVTGLPSSVVRSTIMFSVIAVGQGLNRKPQIYNSISLTAFFMLLINPDYLFDLGFQLSFGAVWSIVYFQPKLKALFGIKHPLLRPLIDLITVSLAAQVITTPLSLYYFQQFPNYFLLTNLLVIPLSALIIYLAMLLFVIAPFPLVAGYVAMGLVYSIRWMNNAIEYIQHLPFAVSNYAVSYPQVPCVFAALLFLCLYLEYKKMKMIVISMVFILVFFVLSAQMYFQTYFQKRIFFFADYKNTHLCVCDGNEGYSYTTDSVDFGKTVKSFSLNERVALNGKIQEQDWFRGGFFEFSNKKFVLICDTTYSSKCSQKPIEVDYMFIGNHLKPRPKELFAMFRPKKVIADQTISRYYTEKIHQACVRQGISFYSLHERGAYVLNFKN